MENVLIPELTNGEFGSFVKQGYVFLDFFAEWCMPCMMMGPIVEDLGDEFKGKVKVGKVNIEDNLNLAKKFNVISIPHFIIMKDGEVLDSLNGSRSQDELSEFILSHI